MNEPLIGRLAGETVSSVIFVDDPSWDIWRTGEDTFAGRDWS